MQSIPFIIEIRNKEEDSDKIVGICRINLSKIPDYIPSCGYQSKYLKSFAKYVDCLCKGVQEIEKLQSLNESHFD